MLIGERQKQKERGEREDDDNGERASESETAFVCVRRSIPIPRGRSDDCGNRLVSSSDKEIPAEIDVIGKVKQSEVDDQDFTPSSKIFL
nr:hypothetical protein Iba_chr04cCG10420 [Ipomoea batatas]